jgi:hypothetical protein
LNSSYWKSQKALGFALLIFNIAFDYIGFKEKDQILNPIG